MNRVMRLLFGAALLGSAISASAAEIAGNVTLATDYRFRGISQIERRVLAGDPGWLRLGDRDGVLHRHLGVEREPGQWRRDRDGRTTADSRARFNEDVGYDIGVLYYGYPQDNTTGTTLDYTEVYGSLTFKGAKVGLNYSDDYFAESGKFYYPYIDYGFDPIENVTFSFHYGVQLVR